MWILVVKLTIISPIHVPLESLHAFMHALSPCRQFKIKEVNLHLFNTLCQSLVYGHLIVNKNERKINRGLMHIYCIYIVHTDFQSIINTTCLYVQTASTVWYYVYCMYYVNLMYAWRVVSAHTLHFELTNLCIIECITCFCLDIVILWQSVWQFLDLTLSHRQHIVTRRNASKIHVGNLQGVTDTVLYKYCPICNKTQWAQLPYKVPGVWI